MWNCEAVSTCSTDGAQSFQSHLLDRDNLQTCIPEDNLLPQLSIT